MTIEVFKKSDQRFFEYAQKLASDESEKSVLNKLENNYREKIHLSNAIHKEIIELLVNGGHIEPPTTSEQDYIDDFIGEDLDISEFEKEIYSRQTDPKYFIKIIAEVVGYERHITKDEVTNSRFGFEKELNKRYSDFVEILYQELIDYINESEFTLKLEDKHIKNSLSLKNQSMGGLDMYIVSNDSSLMSETMLPSIISKHFEKLSEILCNINQSELYSLIGFGGAGSGTQISPTTILRFFELISVKISEPSTKIRDKKKLKSAIEEIIEIAKLAEKNKLTLHFEFEL